MIKILLRLLVAIIFISSLYLIYFNKNFSSIEQLLYKRSISVKILNLPEILLELKEENVGFQYDLLNHYLDKKNLKGTYSDSNYNFDIEIDISSDVCAKCILINQDDLLLVSGPALDSGDVEIIDDFKNISIPSSIKEKFTVSYADIDIDEVMYNLNNGLIAQTVVTRNTYLFYKKYYSYLKIQDNLGLINLVWKFPYDDGSIIDDVNDYLLLEDTQDFITDLKDKYYSSNTITSHIFTGSRIFISDMINKLPKYEDLFKYNANKYNLDWKLLAAISYQESKWNNNAVSPTGVKGLMMLTKNTANMLNVNRLIPEESIDGATRYLDKLKNIFNEYQEDMRINLMLAAYNLGPGHVQDIIHLAKGNNIQIQEWKILKEYLLKLHKKKYYKDMKFGYARGWEAVQYVKNVKQYYDILSFLETTDNLNNDILNEVPDTL